MSGKAYARLCKSSHTGVLRAGKEQWLMVLKIECGLIGSLMDEGRGELHDVEVDCSQSSPVV